MTDFRGEFIISETITRGRRIINSLFYKKDHTVDFIDDEKLYKALNAKINVAKIGASKRRHGFASESLSQKWLISLEAVRRKVQHTTQRGIRTILHSYLSHRFKNNDLSLR